MRILAAVSCVLIACGGEPVNAPVVAPAQPAPPAAPAPPPQQRMPKDAPTQASPIDASWKTHDDAQLKVAFRYPGDYLLRSKRLPSGLTSIVMLADDEFARAWLAGTTREATDGPMQITLQLRRVPVSGTFEEFIRGEVERNGGGSELESTSVAGAPALAYATEGLWGGRTVSILASQDPLPLASGRRRMFIIDAHVDFNSREDRIRKDFEAILSTLKLGGTM